MSFCRYFGIGLRPYLNVSSECRIKKMVLEVKYTPLAVGHTFLRQKSTNSNNDEVVYLGPLTKQIKRVKVFSILSSVTGILVQPIIYERAQDLGTSTPMLVALCSVVGFFTFITPVLLHFVTKKYVTTIRYSTKDDLYTATTYTLLVKKKEISFKPGEAVVPDVLGMFTSMTIRGIPLFIDARFFDDIFHYKRIMGYDKPIDFKIIRQEKQNDTGSE